MTQSTHLIKQYAVTLEVTPLQFETMGEFLRQITEKQLHAEADQIGMAVSSVQHRQEVVKHFDEEGNQYDMVRLACVASGYLTSESAEQTLRKIEIANAIHREWLDDDD